MGMAAIPPPSSHMDLKRLDWILVKAQDMDLTTWEASFIDRMTERREKYGDRTIITEREAEILEEIAGK